jgi:hypothetical protein
MEVHLDPDIREEVMARSVPFRAAFGQSGGSQSHLANCGVRKGESEGDLFLFFGLYRQAEQGGPNGFRYVRGTKALHVIYGWLQVASICYVQADGVPAGLERHPHALRSFIVENELSRQSVDNNTIYTACEQLSFSSRAGYGVFEDFDSYDAGDPRRMTATNAGSVTEWCLPSFFCAMSNMGVQPLAAGPYWYPNRRGRGQEFVFNTAGHEQEVEVWLHELFART